MTTERVEVAPRITPDRARMVGEANHDHGASQSIIPDPKKKDIQYFNGEDARQIDGPLHNVSRESRNDPQSVVSQAKSFLSISNEYWLIGIIIVLITVILMLIVYIMKIKQGSPDVATDRGPNQTNTKSRDDERGAEHKTLSLRDSATSENAKIQYLNQRRFVPHSAPTIEPIDDQQPEEEHTEEHGTCASGAPDTAPILTMCCDAAPLEESRPASETAPVMMPPAAEPGTPVSQDRAVPASTETPQEPLRNTPTRRARVRGHA